MQLCSYAVLEPGNDWQQMKKVPSEKWTPSFSGCIIHLNHFKTFKPFQLVVICTEPFSLVAKFTYSSFLLVQYGTISTLGDGRDDQLHWTFFIWTNRISMLFRGKLMYCKKSFWWASFRGSFTLGWRDIAYYLKKNCHGCGRFWRVLVMRIKVIDLFYIFFLFVIYLSYLPRNNCLFWTGNLYTHLSLRSH